MTGAFDFPLDSNVYSINLAGPTYEFKAESSDLSYGGVTTTVYVKVSYSSYPTILDEKTFNVNLIDVCEIDYFSMKYACISGTDYVPLYNQE